MPKPTYETALIVGAGRGLSASLARLLADRGLQVALAARDTEKLAPLCTETGAKAFACDAVAPDQVARLFTAVEAAIGDHLARAAAAPPTPEELAGARRRILTEYWSALELLSNRADSLSQFTTYFDDPGRLAGEPDRYRSLAASELQELAAGFLRPDARAVVTVVPKPSLPSSPS